MVGHRITSHAVLKSRRWPRYKWRRNIAESRVHERYRRQTKDRRQTDAQKNAQLCCLPRCMECRRGLAMRILSICPSVRPSVTRVNCDKTVERSVQIIPYERTFSLVSEKKNGWWGRPLLPEILGQAAPGGAKSPILNR